MRALSRYWALLIAVPAIVGACDGGGGSSSGASGSGDDDDDSCRFTSNISGGLQASFTGKSAACAYTSRAVSLTELGGSSVVVLVHFGFDLQPGQTGPADATIEVNQKNDHWRGAKCRVDIASNEKVSGPDAGSRGAFDNYLLKGSGTCSTPASYLAGDGGAQKPPVEISPFTFSLRVLFY